MNFHDVLGSQNFQVGLELSQSRNEPPDMIMGSNGALCVPCCSEKGESQSMRLLFSADQDFRHRCWVPAAVTTAHTCLFALCPAGAERLKSAFPGVSWQQEALAGDGKQAEGGCCPCPDSSRWLCSGRGIAVLPGRRPGEGDSASQHLPRGGGGRFQRRSNGGPQGRVITSSFYSSRPSTSFVTKSLYKFFCVNTQWGFCFLD